MTTAKAKTTLLAVSEIRIFFTTTAAVSTASFVLFATEEGKLYVIGGLNSFKMVT